MIGRANIDLLTALLKTADIKFDEITGAQVNIPVEHHEVHENDAYNVNHVFAGVANDAVAAIQIKTPANRDLHLKRIEPYITGAKGIFEIVEAPTLTDGTTPVAVINQSRTGTPPASDAVAYSDPSGISGGTVLETRTFGGGGEGKKAPAGSRPIEMEFILRRSTTYLLRVTNKSGTEETIDIWAFWYEEA